MFITKNALLFCVFLLSRSSRSAWIEIDINTIVVNDDIRRAPRGARGLKSKLCKMRSQKHSRAPRGARGLKFFVIQGQL